MASLYLVAEGDSLTVGFASSGTFGPYPMQLALMYPPTRMVSVQNFATTGDNIGNITSQAATEVDPDYDSRKTPVLLVWIGTNDLVGPTLTPAQLFTQLGSYCTARRALGYKVIVFTVLPRSGAGTSVTFETDRQTFNTSLRAGYTAFADGIADVGANALIGIAGAPTNATYYNADQIHLVNAGYAIVASIAYSALAPIVGS